MMSNSHTCWRYSTVIIYSETEGFNILKIKMRSNLLEQINFRVLPSGISFPLKLENFINFENIKRRDSNIQLTLYQMFSFRKF